MTLETYCSTLDAWAAEARAQAASAKEAGDERMHSIHLMRASMMGDMLKVLGRVEMNGRSGILEKNAQSCDAEAEKQRAREDFDQAERCLIKAETIRRALALLKEEEA